jgi:hypothetical protein
MTDHEDRAAGKANKVESYHATDSFSFRAAHKMRRVIVVARHKLNRQ